jgi:hypothetical protein
MVASITRIKSAVHFLVNQILIYYCRPKYLDYATFSKDLLPIFML